MIQTQTTLFQQACAVFDGWDDPETGLRVLSLRPKTELVDPELADWFPLNTVYHQYPPFQEHGTRVLVRINAPGGVFAPEIRVGLLDLTTGALTPATRDGWRPFAFHDGAGTGSYVRESPEGIVASIRDYRTGQELASYVQPGWTFDMIMLLADGRRAIVGHRCGDKRTLVTGSQLHLLEAGGRCSLLIDAEGYFCNHIQGCPADPDLYAYDRWPMPRRRVDNVIHLSRTDGSFHQPLPMLEGTLKPGGVFGCHRDHYLWAPDGRRIISYLGTYGNDDPEAFDLPWDDHFDLEWWVSAMDWRTGEDLCVKYPPERWGCNFAVSPDSRFIATAGGRQFQYLYLIEIEQLRRGWNERPLCRYPESVEDGRNKGPFHMPFVLPDQSGVLFTAGWPGPQHGVYLVEWPGDATRDH